MSNLYKKLAAFFGKKQPAQVESSLPHSGLYSSSMLGGTSDTAMRGQLVQVMMRDLVRKSGIPQGWVQCQIQIVNSRSRGQGIYVRLIVKHWDERLMKYAFAFQKALLTDVVNFEPHASQWLQGISWQLEVAATCPVTQLPSAQFWKPVREIDPFDIVPVPASAMPIRTPLVTPQPVRPPVTTTLTKPAPLAPALATLPALPVLPVATGAAAFALSKPLDESFVADNEAADDLEKLFAIRDKELESMAFHKMLPEGYERTEPSPL